MPNVAKVLKDEISRIARKEAKAAVAPLRKPSVRARHDVADLKQRVAVLEQVNRDLVFVVSKLADTQPAAPAAEQESKGWISGKGIRSLRNRLGLSQDEFARLVGVSAQGVYQWERKTGMLKLRDATKAKVFAVRGLGAREAKARLAEMPKAVKAAKKTAKPATKRRKTR